MIRRLVFILLLAVMSIPVWAEAAERHYLKTVAVGFHDVRIATADAPGPHAVSVWASILIDDGQIFRDAGVIFLTEPGGDIVSNHFYAIGPSDFVMNATTTTATLRLPDGSILIWTATGDGEREATLGVTRRAGMTTTSQETVLANVGRVTGTIAGHAIDSGMQPAPGPGGQNGVVLFRSSTDELSQ